MAISGPTLAEIWPAKALAALHRHWIETAFQIASIARSDGGVNSLVEITGIPVTQVTDAVAATLSLLSDAENRELALGVDPDSMSLGALKPRD